MAEAATESDLSGLISDVGNEAQSMLIREAGQNGIIQAFSVLGRPNRTIDRYSKLVVELGETSAAGLRQTLSGLIQGKTNNRVRLKRQGRRIDTGRIAMLKGGETRIFRSKATSQSETAAIQFLLDHSGSMKNHILEAEAAVYSLLKALDGIPEVTTGALAFPTLISLGSSYEEGTALIKQHGEKLSQAVAANSFGSTPYGGTPLSNALWSAVVELNRGNVKKADKRILFVLTDGQPDDVFSAKQMVKDIEKAGIKVVCLGFGDIDHYVVKNIFSIYRNVGSASNLRASLFDLVREMAF